MGALVGGVDRWSITTRVAVGVLAPSTTSPPAVAFALPVPSAHSHYPVCVERCFGVLVFCVLAANCLAPFLKKHFPGEQWVMARSIQCAFAFSRTLSAHCLCVVARSGARICSTVQLLTDSPKIRSTNTSESIHLTCPLCCRAAATLVAVFSLPRL